MKSSPSSNIKANFLFLGLVVALLKPSLCRGGMPENLQLDSFSEGGAVVRLVKIAELKHRSGKDVRDRPEILVNADGGFSLFYYLGVKGTKYTFDPDGKLKKRVDIDLENTSFIAGVDENGGYVIFNYHQVGGDDCMDDCGICIDAIKTYSPSNALENETKPISVKVKKWTFSKDGKYLFLVAEYDRVLGYELATGTLRLDKTIPGVQNVYLCKRSDNALGVIFNNANKFSIYDKNFKELNSVSAAELHNCECVSGKYKNSDGFYVLSDSGLSFVDSTNKALYIADYPMRPSGDLVPHVENDRIFVNDDRGIYYLKDGKLVTLYHANKNEIFIRKTYLVANTMISLESNLLSEYDLFTVDAMGKNKIIYKDKLDYNASPYMTKLGDYLLFSQGKLDQVFKIKPRKH